MLVFFERYLKMREKNIQFKRSTLFDIPCGIASANSSYIVLHSAFK